MFQPTFLPGRSYPRPGEIFSSWLGRIAVNQGMSPLLLWYELCPSTSFKKQLLTKGYMDMDRYQLPDLLPILSLSTDIPLEHIYETTIWDWKVFVKPSLSKGSTVLIGWWIPFRGNRKHALGPSFCGSCFRRDGSQPYFRKVWRFSFNVACLDCGVLLANACPKCHRGVNYQELNSNVYLKSHKLASTVAICSFCGYNLANTRMYPASSSVLELQRILQCLSTEEMGDISFTSLYFKWLEQIAKTLKSCNDDRLKMFSSRTFLIKDKRIANRINLPYVWPTDLQARVLYQSMELFNNEHIDLNKNMILKFEELYFKIAHLHRYRYKYVNPNFKTPLLSLLHQLVKKFPSNWMDKWSAFNGKGKKIINS